MHGLRDVYVMPEYSYYCNRQSRITFVSRPSVLPSQPIFLPIHFVEKTLCKYSDATSSEWIEVTVAYLK